MSAISVLVPEPASGLIEARVASGEYASASDYVSDLILRDQPLSADDAECVKSFDASIAQGLADCEAGRVFDSEEVFAELEAEYSAMADAEKR